MRFEERDLKSFAEPVTASLPREGEVYFSVQLGDDSMLMSYREGVRYDTATPGNASRAQAASTHHRKWR